VVYVRFSFFEMVLNYKSTRIMMVKIALFVVTMVKVARLGSGAPYAGSGRIKTVLGQIPTTVVVVTATTRVLPQMLVFKFDYNKCGFILGPFVQSQHSEVTTFCSKQPNKLLLFKIKTT
jgi:hypothetical protein